MSDVIVSTTESTTNVTTTNDVTTIAITDTVVEVSQATAGLQGPPGSNSDPIYIFVRNATGAQLNKGTIVYVSGANGTHVQVTPASASSDATSARTVGWLADDIANNASGLCQIEGYLESVNTQAFNEGDQLYLSTTAGGFTNTKPQAPTHLVYVGVVAKKSAGNGKVFVKVQNGYELDELHNVQIISVADKNLIQYDSATDLWKNVAATAITVGSAIVAGTASYATNAGTSVYATTSGTSVYSAQSGTASYATAALSATSSNSAYTALIAGTAVFANTAGTSTYALSAGTATALTGSISRSQITDFTSGTVASADYATLAGTASFATAASTATNAGAASNAQYAVQAGTAVNISGTVLQSQVTNLTTDLAGKANLAGGNSFTGAQVITASTATQIPVQVRAAASPSVNVQEWDNSAGAVQASIDANFRGNFPRVTAGSTADLGYAILSVNTGATATMGLVVRGVASQGTPFIDIQNNAGNSLFRVNNSGFAAAAFGIIGGGSAQASGANNTLYSTGTASVGLVVRGAASQTANLQEWQTSSGGTSARVDSGGIVYGTQVRGLSSLVLLTEASGGGLVTLARATATPSSPGANTARLYFRDGTNANTLKLVVRAGAAGAETTILDNIPT